MYQVNVGSDILYYPGSDDAVIYDTELNEEVGLAGEFSFKVPSNNPQYANLTTGALITIYKNDKEFWRGEIKDVKTDFAKVASVYAIEDLAWLGDEFLVPTSITNETYTQRFQAAITSYNSNRGSDRQFVVGYLSNVTASNNCNWRTEYEWSILDSLRNCICDASSDKGYIKVRRVTSGGTVTRYIDIVPLSQYGVTASQPIEYGYNLLDYVKEMDYGNLVNVLTPYGDETESEVYTDYNARLQGNTITNAASVAAYGRHAKVVVFDGVSNATSLNNLAASYLSRYCQPQITMEVQAVDLAEIESVDEIKIGDSVRIIAAPFAIDQYLYLTQIRRDIQNLDKNTITMSGHVTSGRTITSQMISATDAIEETPSRWSILESAKRNALNMLLDETQGGYVVYEYDANNKYVVAINICNAKTIDASTKRWRWSYNGLGFLSRNSTSSPWPTSSIPIAITNDGKINADRILTGTLDADTVTVHGQIQATSGYIGNSTNGWQIANKNIHNGPTSLNNTSTEGMYVGVDGIRTNGSSGKTTKISGGIVTSNQVMSAEGFYAISGDAGVSSTNNGTVFASHYELSDGTTGKSTDAFAFTANVGGTQKTIGLYFQEGLLVGTSGF